jgi:D-ornithine 4,5-aminomutase subunit beta
MDGLREMVKVDREAPELKARVREIKERAVLFLEAMIADGGYFAGVEEAYFVDSGEYPETHDDGIARRATAAWPRTRSCRAPTTTSRRSATTSARTTCPRVPRQGVTRPRPVIGGCTLCEDAKVPYIDELDPEDNVNERLAETAEMRERGLIKPEVEWAGDGVVVVTMFLPAAADVAEAAALELGKAMNLAECEVIHKRSCTPPRARSAS